MDPLARFGVVILDGPDAVGKTTLAMKLLNGDESGYAHLTYYEDKELWRAQYFTLLKAQIRMGQGKLTVIDRHWPSELVYSRAYRDGTNMNAEARGWDRVMKRLSGIYVICAPDPVSASARHAESLKQRHEMYPSDERIDDTARRYYDWWHGNPFAEDPSLDYIVQTTFNGGMKNRRDAMLYDIDKDGHDLDAFCEKIYDRLTDYQVHQYPAAFNGNKMNFLGHLETADTLFVGDRINPRKTGRWPFIDFGASSAVLSNILHALNWDEGRGLWTNMHGAKDEHVLELLKFKPSLRVVALGVEPANSLQRLEIEHACVFHPSYAGRFNKKMELQVQLAEVLK